MNLIVRLYIQEGIYVNLFVSKILGIGNQKHQYVLIQVFNIMDITGDPVYERRFELNTDVILISFTYHSFVVYTCLSVADKSSPWCHKIFGNVLYIAAHRRFKQAMGFLCKTYDVLGFRSLCSRYIPLQHINHLSSKWHKTRVMHFCSTLAVLLHENKLHLDLFAECISFCSIQTLCAAYLQFFSTHMPSC